MTRVLVRQIIEEVLKTEGLTLGEFLSEARTRRVARPRQRSMYVSKKLTKLSLSEIGRRHGGRDHATVIYAIRKIEALIASDPYEAQKVAELLSAFAPCPLMALVGQVRAETEALVA